MDKKHIDFVHFYMIPFTGFGLHNGYRGDQWLKNRIKIFIEFVIPSIKLQESREIYLWFCWRPEERHNPIVKEFIRQLDRTDDILHYHTFHGIPMYDDKYSDSEAKERLMECLTKSLPEFRNHVGNLKYVLLTIQPSDDMYLHDTRKRLRDKFTELVNANPDNLKQVVGYKKGYIMDYSTKEIAEYSTLDWTTDRISTYHTDTIPPFFTILFPADTFLNPRKHMEWIGPYKSHEYINEFFDYNELEGRGFVVGCHGENISTVYNHRYKGRILSPSEQKDILLRTGTLLTDPLKFKPSGRLRARRIINKLPFRQQIKNIYYSLPTKIRIV